MLILKFTVLLVLIVVCLPTPVFTGRLHGSIEHSTSEKDRNHVFWFSHCFSPADFVHSVASVSDFLASFKGSHTVFILGQNTEMLNKMVDMYTRYQMKIRNRSNVTFHLVGRPHNLKNRLRKPGHHAIVFNPYNTKVQYSRNEEILKRQILKQFYPVWNPNFVVPSSTTIIICNLQPTGTVPTDTCIRTPLSLQYGWRALRAEYTLTTRPIRRHFDKVDQTLVEMLRDAVRGMHRLGMCDSDASE